MVNSHHDASFRPTFELRAWKYMRLSAILLVPLVWIHAVINTLLIGSENIHLDLVAQRWAMIGWQIYDILLLGLAFSHGMGGLRQVLFDFAAMRTTRRFLTILIIVFWFVLFTIGILAIIGGVRR